MPTPNRFVAADTDILLALAAGDDECLEAFDSLSKAGFYFIATETPLQELADIFQHGADPEVKGHAKNTLSQVTNLGFLSPSLGSVQLGVAERVAHKIVEKCIHSENLNDGLVVAEAAYNGCRLLITRRKPLVDSKSDSLQIALVDSDLCAVVIVPPADIVTYFRSIQTK